jgi:hypothetical protein
MIGGMWGLFGKPKCPINAEMREWVDGRFRWLQDQLGIETPCKASVILPTPEFFPDPYEGTIDDVRVMFRRIAGYMNVDPDRFKLYVFNNAVDPRSLGSVFPQTSGPAGLYHHRTADDSPEPIERAAIGIESKQLADPMSLVATLAHEIGHDILLGEKRIARDEQDHEPLTDLLTVFLGLGVFTANSTIHDRGWSSGGWSGWKTSRLGYLDQRTFGYALALFAFVRSERNPAWIRRVRPDVRVPLKESLRFLASEM